MRVAVVGAGAMGSLVSYLLETAGAELVLYESRETRLADIRTNGIRLRGAIDGRVFPEVRSPREPAAPFDLIILAVAAGDEGAALRPLSPLVHRETRYLSLQEGSAVEELARMVGDDRAGGAVSLVSAVETSSGEVDVEEFRSIVIGGFLPRGEPEFSSLVNMLNAGLAWRAELVTDFDREIWKRLEACAAVSELCGVLGAAPEEIKSIQGVNTLCEEAAGECRSLAASAGLEIPASVSPWEDAVWKWIKPPLLRDLESARRTEVECLSGHIVNRARARGKAVPVHSALYSLTKELESGKRHPGEASLKELQRRIEEEKGMSLL
jgi:2-dehydropantoate 2-reductase